MNREATCAHIALFREHLHTTKHVSSHTLRSYTSDLALLLAFWEQEELTAEHDFTFVRIIKRYRAMLTTQKMRPSSLARKISCFNSLIRFIASTGADAGELITRPRVQLKTPDALSPADITYLLETLTPEQLPTPAPYRDLSIIALLYATGIRCSEIIGIRQTDINTSAQSITIFDQQHTHSRTVFFGARANHYLNQYLATERPPVRSISEYLFLNHRLAPLTTRSIQRICLMFGEALPQKRTITPHVLRQSFTVHLLQRGADPATVQELLGYTTPISMQRYLR